MTEALSIENFAQQMVQAESPEQPPEDSDAASPDVVEEGQPDDAPVLDEAQAEAEPEQSGEPETEPDQIISWKTASGEEFSVPVGELKDGYLRQQDYTRKAQQVAGDRTQAQAEIHQQVQVIQALADQIGEFKAITNQLTAYEQVNWAALKESDPVAYFEHRDKYRELKDNAKEADTRIRNARGQLEQHQSASFAEGVAKAEKHLTENVKGVTRDEVLKAFGVLQNGGADQRTIDLVRSTPALAEAVIYATRWMELQKTKPQVTNKLKALPPVAAKARPAAAQPGKLESVSKIAASRKTFSVGDFAQLLKATRS